MKITKLEHACLDISTDNGRLIIDPGHWTSPLGNYDGIAVVVITHVHQDHLDESKILEIAQANPDVVIYCTEQVAARLSSDLSCIVPQVGSPYTTGPFTLEFFGGIHAIIMDSYPQDQNFGVLVNGTLYYPGDSLTLCEKPHEVTAVPSVAPWLKTSEAADFIKEDTAKVVFPTHNNIVNENGEQLYNRLLGGVAEASGKTYRPLRPGESIEVS